MTLVEIVVVLAILAMLLAILVPIVTQHIRDSRMSKAKSDVKSIGTAIQRMWVDTKFFPIFSDASGILFPLKENLGDVVVLEGPGNMPAIGAGVDAIWTAATPSGAECANAGVAPLRDDLEDHLVTNRPVVAGGPGWPAGPAAGTRAWRGPYLEDISPDPWGTKYLVNMINIVEQCVVATNAVFVISAGPDGEINTNFDISVFDVNDGLPENALPADDDIVFRIK